MTPKCTLHKKYKIGILLVQKGQKALRDEVRHLRAVAAARTAVENQPIADSAQEYRFHLCDISVAAFIVLCGANAALSILRDIH